jgi:hypothetical protein
MLLKSWHRLRQRGALPDLSFKAHKQLDVPSFDSFPEIVKSYFHYSFKDIESEVYNGQVPLSLQINAPVVWDKTELVVKQKWLEDCKKFHISFEIIRENEVLFARELKSVNFLNLSQVHLETFGKGKFDRDSSISSCDFNKMHTDLQLSYSKGRLKVTDQLGDFFMTTDQYPAFYLHDQMEPSLLFNMLAMQYEYANRQSQKIDNYLAQDKSRAVMYTFVITFLSFLRKSKYFLEKNNISSKEASDLPFIDLGRLKECLVDFDSLKKALFGRESEEIKSNEKPKNALGVDDFWEDFLLVSTALLSLLNNLGNSVRSNDLKFIDLMRDVSIDKFEKIEDQIRYLILDRGPSKGVISTVEDWTSITGRISFEEKYSINTKKYTELTNLDKELKLQNILRYLHPKSIFSLANHCIFSLLKEGEPRVNSTVRLYPNFSNHLDTNAEDMTKINLVKNIIIDNREFDVYSGEENRPEHNFVYVRTSKGKGRPAGRWFQTRHIPNFSIFAQISFKPCGQYLQVIYNNNNKQTGTIFYLLNLKSFDKKACDLMGIYLEDWITFNPSCNHPNLLCYRGLILMTQERLANLNEVKINENKAVIGLKLDLSRNIEGIISESNELSSAVGRNKKNCSEEEINLNRLFVIDGAKGKNCKFYSTEDYLLILSHNYIVLKETTILETVIFKLLINNQSDKQVLDKKDVYVVAESCYGERRLCDQRVIFEREREYERWSVLARYSSSVSMLIFANNILECVEIYAIMNQRIERMKILEKRVNKLFKLRRIWEDSEIIVGWVRDKCEIHFMRIRKDGIKPSEVIVYKII